MALLAGLLASCSPGGKRAEAPLAFFDLKGYMEAEVKALQKRQPKAYKSLTFNGKTEEQRPGRLDYAQELALFIQADINRPAWRESYRIDSVSGSAGLEALEYEALNEDLPTRRLRIDFGPGGGVSRILVRERHHSVLANSERELVYLPDEGYRINAAQQGQSGDNVVAMQVTWLKAR